MTNRLLICISLFCLSFSTIASAQTYGDFDSEGNFKIDVFDRYRFLNEMEARSSGAMDGGGGFELPSYGDKWGEAHEGEEPSTIDCQELIFRLYLHYGKDSTSALDDPEIMFNYFCVGD